MLSWDEDLIQEDRLYYRNGSPFTGQLDDTNLNLKVIASAQLKNGLLHGLFTERYRNGAHKKKTTKNYKMGYEDGVQEGWHRTGNLSYKYVAHQGLKNGLYQEFYPNGKLQIEAYNIDGVEVKRKVIDIEGDVIVNYEIKNGRYYGLLGSSSCISVYEGDEYQKANRR
jgi:antitoxin component YwqK of YwqJK toxin-antitoxin module